MAATPIGPYSPVVRAGDWVVTSGQIGAEDGRLVDGGFDAEMRQAMANLAAVLATEGLDLTRVVKTTVFLRHISDYPTMNEIYTEIFDGHRPARSAFAVGDLPMGALVEIEAWAHVPTDT